MTFIILHSSYFSDDQSTDEETKRRAWQTMIRAHIYCFPKDIAVDRETIDAYINYRRPHWCEMKRLLKEVFDNELPYPSGF